MCHGRACRGHPCLSWPHPRKTCHGRPSLPSPAMTRVSQAQRWLVLYRAAERLTAVPHVSWPCLSRPSMSFLAASKKDVSWPAFAAFAGHDTGESGSTLAGTKPEDGKIDRCAPRVMAVLVAAIHVFPGRIQERRVLAGLRCLRWP